MIGLARWSVNRLLRWRLAALEATSGSDSPSRGPLPCICPSWGNELKQPEPVALLRLITRAKPF
ncbi:hypothetical protein DFQ14_101253 [Halopolyspora algeriensis]|uniref:Uncharacterized protein n=1 Tax=Halopolyspora algeriensis TaxID=1500506 RepID=A0A368W2K1_9ACTN|nr:hypothetical protein DFQ14_101253 [Halopolyspora algeriensis]TQM48004.1 hypothetical protein FHU43_2956 [Halopolyspora algeriensis]